MATQIFGHKNPDTDAIVSAIVGAEYFQLFGIDAQAVALGQPNDETKFVLDYFGVEMPKVIKKATEDTVILVDHNEAEQSVDNLKDVKISHVIDHHKINFDFSEPIFFHSEVVGSTSTIFYYFMKVFDKELSREAAGLLLSAIISDTLLLKSPTTTQFDRDAVPDLAKLAEIEDYNDYGMQMLKAGTNLDDKTEKQLVDGDAKTFEIKGKKWRIGQVNTVDIDSVLARKDKILKTINKQMDKDGYDNFLFVITDIINSNSQAIFMGEDIEMLSAAFDNQVIDSVIDLPGVVSRKKQIVPPLEKA